MGDLVVRDIKPRTINQKKVFDAYNQGKHLFLSGYPGTGKTFLALYLGLKEVLNENKRMIIFRSATPSRQIGFLKGGETEKMEVYEVPYKAICGDLFGRGDAYEILKKKDFLEFSSTSFIRGMTINNSVVIIDEWSNMNFQELSSLITRIGENTRVIFTGDIQQSDLYNFKEKNGAIYFSEICQALSSFEIINFEIDDILRSGLVKEFIIAKEDYFKTHKIDPTSFM